jgi:hypothetical protein
MVWVLAIAISMTWSDPQIPPTLELLRIEPFNDERTCKNAAEILAIPLAKSMQFFVASQPKTHILFACTKQLHT